MAYPPIGQDYSGSLALIMAVVRRQEAQVIADLASGT